MFNETLQGVRERHWLRWFLVLPVVFIGNFAVGIFAMIYCMGAADWAFDDVTEIFNPPERALPVFSYYFIRTYTWVVLTTILAPRSKRLAGIISALIFFVLIFGCGLWLRSSSGIDSLTYWIRLFFGSDFQDRRCWPWLLGGIVLALVLVFSRIRPRMLLTLPAYFFGFFVFYLPLALILEAILAHRDPDKYVLIENLVNFAGGFGAVGMAAWMSSSNRVRTAIIFLAVTLAYLANSLALYFSLSAYPALAHMDIPGSAEPGLILGALAALGLTCFRTRLGNGPARTIEKAAAAGGLRVASH